ncbi:MAG TPA: hypothetical protein ENJ19_09160 [Gammaproteobacteria bacterium]|nr:hypothetical protein [Gammaproteobacteria bacterium]
MTSRPATALLAMSLLVPAATVADTIQITLTNLTHGSYFTPLLVAAHDSSTHLFQPGSAASASLQAMAEGGDLSGLVADVANVGATYVENPAAGLLEPGASTTTMLDTTGTQNTRLSIVAMILPTNDGFVGLDALTLPATAGTYTFYLNAYDAGTEANDEIVNGAGSPGAPGIPADPGGHSGSGASGAATADNNSAVHIHRGVLGDQDSSGGVSDLDSSVHRWLNPVAKLVLSVNY